MGLQDGGSAIIPIRLQAARIIVTRIPPLGSFKCLAVGVSHEVRAVRLLESLIFKCSLLHGHASLCTDRVCICSLLACTSEVPNIQRRQPLQTLRSRSLSFFWFRRQYCLSLEICRANPCGEHTERDRRRLRLKCRRDCATFEWVVQTISTHLLFVYAYLSTGMTSDLILVDRSDFVNICQSRSLPQ